MKGAGPSGRSATPPQGVVHWSSGRTEYVCTDKTGIATREMDRPYVEHGDQQLHFQRSSYGFREDQLLRYGIAY